MTELQKLCNKLQATGEDPIAVLKWALTESKYRKLLPVITSCLSCKKQRDCSFRDQATSLIQSSHIGKNREQILGTEFYSQIATKCEQFEVTRDVIFGVKS